MKFKYFFQISLCSLFLSQSHLVYAGGDCESFTPNLKLGQTTFTTTTTQIPGKSWYIAKDGISDRINAFGLIDCRATIPDGLAKDKNTQYVLGNKSIALRREQTIDGISYHGLMNTGHPFLDRHAFINFSLQNGDYAGTNTNIEKINGAVRIDQGSALGKSSALDLILHNLHFIFLAPIPYPMSTTLNIGEAVLNMSDSRPYSELPEGQKIVLNHIEDLYVTINFLPVATKTCRMANPTVILPKVSTTSFKKIGDEVSKTNFSYSVSCDPGVGYQLVEVVFLDNAEIENRSNILKNLGTAKDVGIKIYNASDNAEVRFNTAIDFGTIWTSNKETTLTKQFYARYIATGSDVTGGTVEAKAIVHLNYK